MSGKGLGSRAPGGAPTTFDIECPPPPTLEFGRCVGGFGKLVVLDLTVLLDNISVYIGQSHREGERKE